MTPLHLIILIIKITVIIKNIIPTNNYIRSKQPDEPIRIVRKYLLFDQNTGK